LVAEIASNLFPAAFHRRATPRLSDMHSAALSVHVSASELIGAHLGTQVSKGVLAGLLTEYTELETKLKKRYEEGPQRYPDYYAVGDESSFLMYGLVRILRPETLVETGVANGHSSYFILSALRENAVGTLHGVDIGPDVGGLLRPAERERWRLHVLDTASLKSSFDNLLRSLPPLDFFVHDSDHSYEWQRQEFEAAFDRLSERAVLAGDDVDSSYAFLDVCSRHAKKPMFLIDRRKVFGLVLPTEMVSTDTGRSTG